MGKKTKDFSADQILNMAGRPKPLNFTVSLDKKKPIYPKLRSNYPTMGLDIEQYDAIVITKTSFGSSTVSTIILHKPKVNLNGELSPPLASELEMKQTNFNWKKFALDISDVKGKDFILFKLKDEENSTPITFEVELTYISNLGQIESIEKIVSF